MKGSISFGIVLGCALTALLILQAGLGATLYLPFFVGVGVIVANFVSAAKTVTLGADIGDLVVFAGGGCAAVLLLLSSLFFSAPQS